MKVKTSELIGAPLDWAFAVARGLKPHYTTHWITPRSPDDERRVCVVNSSHLPPFMELYEPTKDWWKTGPLIDELEGFELKKWLDSGCRPEHKCEAHIHNYEGDWIQFGPTARIATVRCYVASELGDEVEIPDELLKEQK